MLFKDALMEERDVEYNLENVNMLDFLFHTYLVKDVSLENTQEEDVEENIVVDGLTFVLVLNVDLLEDLALGLVWFIENTQKLTVTGDKEEILKDKFVAS